MKKFFGIAAAAAMMVFSTTIFACMGNGCTVDSDYGETGGSAAMWGAGTGASSGYGDGDGILNRAVGSRNTVSIATDAGFDAVMGCTDPGCEYLNALTRGDGIIDQAAFSVVEGNGNYVGAGQEADASLNFGGDAIAYRMDGDGVRERTTGGEVDITAHGDGWGDVTNSGDGTVTKSLFIDGGTNNVVRGNMDLTNCEGCQGFGNSTNVRSRSAQVADQMINGNGSFVDGVVNTYVNNRGEGVNWGYRNDAMTPASN